MPFKYTEDRNNYFRTYLKQRYEERMALAIAMLGGQCVECGAGEDLQIDHINPLHKSFSVADKIAQYAWPKIEAELKKCQLLCITCHGKKSRHEQCNGLSKYKTPRRPSPAARAN
jgi:5-methylcytosine-specific restriction endonuclease McrA